MFFGAFLVLFRFSENCHFWLFWGVGIHSWKLVRQDTVQYTKIQYSMPGYSTVCQETVQYARIQYSTPGYSTVRQDTVQYARRQYSTPGYRTLRQDTVQYARIQYCIVRQDTVQYARIQQNVVYRSGVYGAECNGIVCNTYNRAGHAFFSAPPRHQEKFVRGGIVFSHFGHTILPPL